MGDLSGTPGVAVVWKKFFFNICVSRCGYSCVVLEIPALEFTEISTVHISSSHQCLYKCKEEYLCYITIMSRE